LLHINNQTNNNKQSAANTNPPADARSTSGTDINTYCLLKVKPRNHILFATANVEVKNKAGQYISCRALLDSASQSHFITERCALCLQLARTQTHASIQGISHVNTAAYYSVPIQMRSMHSDWNTTLDCAILSNITGTTPSTKLDTSSWNLPKDLRLADEKFDQPGNIDLLIGADIFYDILRSGRHTHAGNFPVIQETVLGWTISGRTPAPKQNGTQHA
jgi:hypothetical protein